MQISVQFRFVGNCPSTPPLSQHFSLAEGWVGCFPETNFFEQGKFFYIRKEFNPHKTFSVHQHGRRVTCITCTFLLQYGRRDVL